MKSVIFSKDKFYEQVDFFFQGYKVYLIFAILQCNSDTNYPELAQNSQVKSIVPNNTAVILYSCHKSQCSWVLHTSDQQATNSKVFTILLGSMIHQNDSQNSVYVPPEQAYDSQNSGKCYSYNYTFIIKATNQDQPKEETHTMRSGRVLNMEISWCPLCA